jgi:hypothetical protein
MIVTHMGNGIVKFEDALAIDKEYMSGFYSRLDKVDINYGQMIDEEHVRTEGQYKLNREEVSKAPVRFTDLYKLQAAEDVDFISKMRDAIHDCVRIYARIFPVVAECIRWGTHGYVIRYENGQSIGPHSDCNIAYEDDRVTPINTFPMQNVLTCGLFLNDDFSGGDLHFRPWAITVKPKPGTIIIYPSSYLGCHEVSPVTDGQRHAYLMWYGHGPIGGISHRPADDLKDIVSNFQQKFIPVGRIEQYG